MRSTRAAGPARFVLGGMCLLLLILLVAVETGHAGKQVVRVSKGIGAGESAMKVRTRARNEAFARAVLQEAAEILPGSLSQERMELLLELLEPRAQSFVLSYTEEDVVQKNDRMSLILSVQINEWVLKDYLKAWGTYYTAAGKSWRYVLHTRSLQEEDRKELRKLEKLTGVQQTASGRPELLLKREGRKGKYVQGRLETAEKEWKVTDTELRAVWKGLWTRYFSQPEVRDRVIERVVLRIKGWDTSTGVQAFDSRLAQWGSMAEKPRLLDMRMHPGRIEGSWLLATVNARELRERLREYTEPRGLTFLLEGERP